jgi:hypothetical protein
MSEVVNNNNKKRKVRSTGEGGQLLTRAEMDAAMVMRDNRCLLQACIVAQRQYIRQGKASKPIPVGRADTATIEEVTKQLRELGFQVTRTDDNKNLTIDFAATAAPPMPCAAPARDSDEDDEE